MPAARPVALITGASAGIGAVFARKLAARGYDLVLVARRAERLHQLAAELAPQGCRAEVLAADLASEPDLQAVEQRLREGSLVTLLVNNAGFGTMGRFFEVPVDKQDEMHRLHVTATYRLSRAALGRMVPARTGAIINVSSVAGFFQTGGGISYCATKAWINSFTEGLDLELHSVDSPVKVQALCPGFTYTEFHDVIKMDRSKIPAHMWMPAEAVVETSLRGLEHGDLFVVPGWKYRLLVMLPRLLPKRLLRNMAIRLARSQNRMAAAGVRT